MVASDRPVEQTNRDANKRVVVTSPKGWLQFKAKKQANNLNQINWHFDKRVAVTSSKGELQFNNLGR